MTAALEVEGVTARLGARAVLRAASFRVQSGEVVGVLGPNGAGKTSLLRAALGVIPLVAGSALLAGRAARGLSEVERAGLAGYLPQERRVAWSLPAWRIVALGVADRAPAAARRIALQGLARVGLVDLADRGVLDMSGGERARVLLARLLATRAPLLVADEPIAGLDPAAQLLVMDLLRQEAAEGRAVVVTLHDLSLAARTCDRLVVLAQGRVVAEGPARQALTPRVLADVFDLDGELVETPSGPVLSAVRRASPMAPATSR